MVVRQPAHHLVVELFLFLFVQCHFHSKCCFLIQHCFLLEFTKAPKNKLNKCLFPSLSSLPLDGSLCWRWWPLVSLLSCLSPFWSGSIYLWGCLAVSSISQLFGSRYEAIHHSPRARGVSGAHTQAPQKLIGYNYKNENAMPTFDSSFFSFPLWIIF